MFTRYLREPQLALFQPCGIVQLLIRKLVVLVEAPRDAGPGLVVRQRVGRQFDGVVAGVFHAQVQGSDRALFPDRLVDVDKIDLRVSDSFAALVLIAILLAVGGVDERAELPVGADIPYVAQRDLAVHIGIQRFDTGADVGVQAVDEALMNGHGIGNRSRRVIATQRAEDTCNTDIPEVAVNGVPDRARQGRCPARKRESVSGTLVVGSQANGGFQHCAVGNAGGADIDGAPAEARGLIGRGGLLYLDGFDDGRREQVQRYDAARQFRGRHGRAVHRDAGVPFAKASHIDELSVHHRQSRHPAQGRRDV